MIDQMEEREYFTLTKKIIEQYDMKKTKENVDELLSKYKQCKFDYFASQRALDNITSCYTPKYSQHSISSNDKVGNNVAKKVDSINFITYVDEILQPLLESFNPRERKYYSHCLINETSEQIFVDTLKISRTGLKPIKNNCVLKIALAFKIAIMKSS